jgi:hypothetical protein
MSVSRGQGGVEATSLTWSCCRCFMARFKSLRFDNNSISGLGLFRWDAKDFLETELVYLVSLIIGVNTTFTPICCECPRVQNSAVLAAP